MGGFSRPEMLEIEYILAQHGNTSESLIPPLLHGT